MITDVRASYESKTVIANALMLILSWGLEQSGIKVPAEVQVSIVTLLNVGLRFVSTGKVTIV